MNLTSFRLPARARLRNAALGVAVVVVAAFGASACGDGRWCEHDATDTVVADSHCRNGERGFEWEPDSDSKTRKKPTTKPAVAATTKPKAPR
ncbi:hypothetical protein AB0C34_17275 [Nocardia sp. NPDC049220]|uniref:hypothetical protein n=1 Tax=Nocardia sp. NPDC049220 TaxID=3155273 RepID=UPI0033F975AC